MAGLCVIMGPNELTYVCVCVCVIWMFSVFQAPCYLSFVSQAILWDRGLYKDNVSDLILNVQCVDDRWNKMYTISIGGTHTALTQWSNERPIQ